MPNGKKAEKVWKDLTGEWENVLRMFGCLLFAPVFVFLGICYGIQAGLIVGTEKTLELLKQWGDMP